MKKKWVIIALSLVIAVLDSTFVYINYIYTKDSLVEGIAQKAEQDITSFNVALDQTYSNLLMLASLYAKKPRVQEIFYKGVMAVKKEEPNGLGPGGEETAKWREKLFNEVGQSWLDVSEEFKARQLHFHLSPGSTSFLRVHRVKKFGDNMDGVRFTVMETNRTKKPQFGFETGRVYSGLRGVVPMFYTNPETGEKIHTGALEAGTAFVNIIGILEKQTDASYTVLLTNEHIKSAMWESSIKKVFKGKEYPCDCVAEASSSLNLEKYIDLYPFKNNKPEIKKPEIIKADNKFYSATFFPLNDFKSKIDASRKPVGYVLVWHDVTAAVQDMEKQQIVNILYAIIGFILFEFMLLWAFRAATVHLEKQIALRTKELEHEIEVKNKFFSIIAHDLKSPFNGILGLTDLMADMGDSFTKEEIIDYAKNVNTSGKQVFTLLQNLLEWGRLQMKKMESHPELFKLKYVVEENINIFRQATSDKNIKIHDKTNETEVFADSDMTRAVIRNLIANAIKFTSSGGEVTISSKEEKAEIIISVSDTGVGMSKEKIEKLFSLGEKTSTTGTAGETGTGLGLPLCKDMIEMNGGRIWIESVEGKGSSFSFSLPSKKP